MCICVVGAFSFLAPGSSPYLTPINSSTSCKKYSSTPATRLFCLLCGTATLCQTFFFMCFCYHVFSNHTTPSPGCLPPEFSPTSPFYSSSVYTYSQVISFTTPNQTLTTGVSDQKRTNYVSITNAICCLIWRSAGCFRHSIILPLICCSFTRLYTQHCALLSTHTHI